MTNVLLILIVIELLLILATLIGIKASL